MKNSKEYAQKIKKLFTALKKDAGKIKKPEYGDPVEALIFAVVSETANESTTRSIIKKLGTNFVDRNDLRVSRAEEILEVVGGNAKQAEKIARELTGLLNSVFNKYDRVSLSELGEDGKRAAKEILEKFAGITNFICSYTMLTALEAHAIPINDKMFEYLKEYQLIDAKATIEDTAAFLERQISAANAYIFYAVLRADAESSKPKANDLFTKATKKTTKKVAKKTAKKKTAKKK